MKIILSNIIIIYSLHIYFVLYLLRDCIWKVNSNTLPYLFLSLVPYFAITCGKWSYKQITAVP